jgi:hypothetical protein
LFTSAKENEQVEEAFKVLALQSLKWAQWKHV